MRYPRDPSLDPQLVWRGKDEQDSEDLVVPAVPIYIQEKVDPRIIVENLRRTAAQTADEPELSLFDDFDGQDVADFTDKIDFYKHEANCSNRMIPGDSLVAMTSLAEKERLRGKVQMIYLDPPVWHQVRLELAGVHPQAGGVGWQGRRHDPPARTDPRLPGHLEARYSLLFVLPP